MMRRQVNNDRGRQATGQRNISDQERVLNQYCAMGSLERLRLTVRGHYCDEDLTFFLEQAASRGHRVLHLDGIEDLGFHDMRHPDFLTERAERNQKDRQD